MSEPESYPPPTYPPASYPPPAYPPSNYPAAGYPPPYPPAARPDPPKRHGAEHDTLATTRFAVSLTAALLLLGALLGLIWALWTPAGPLAAIFPGGGFVTDETTEGVVAGDGRYLVLAAAAGVITPLATWTLARFRGPITMLALGLGSLLGACVMQVVGGLAEGGSYVGRRVNSNGTEYEVTQHLPLDVRATGLVFVWPALAALVYGMFTAFAARDDLGRADPVRDSLVSVDPGGQPHGGGGHGDTARALQQGDLPPQ